MKKKIFLFSTTTGGKGCPPPDELTQVETCRVEPCGGAAWSPGPWGRCSLPSRAVCGPGRQTRELYCRDHLNNTVPSYRQGIYRGTVTPILSRLHAVIILTHSTPSLLILPFHHQMQWHDSPRCGAGVRSVVWHSLHSHFLERLVSLPGPGPLPHG